MNLMLMIFGCGQVTTPDDLLVAERILLLKNPQGAVSGMLT